MLLILIFISSCYSNNAKVKTNNNIWACKEAASSKWLSDFAMHHNNPTYEEQIRLIQQVPFLTEVISTHCEGDNVNYEILKAAKSGIKPKWIEYEINAKINKYR